MTNFEVETAAAEQGKDADASGAGQRAQGVAYGGGADADGGSELALGGTNVAPRTMRCRASEEMGVEQALGGREAESRGEAVGRRERFVERQRITAEVAEYAEKRKGMEHRPIPNTSMTDSRGLLFRLAQEFLTESGPL